MCVGLFLEIARKEIKEFKKYHQVKFYTTNRTHNICLRKRLRDHFFIISSSTVTCLLLQVCHIDFGEPLHRVRSVFKCQDG